MAQKVNIVLVDDIDQTDADETLTFGLDGKNYEIDLNTKNANALREALAPYVGHDGLAFPQVGHLLLARR